MLNGEPLELIDGMKLPDLNPEVVTDSEGLNLKLAAGNIGFWVIPNAKVNIIILPKLCKLQYKIFISQT